MNKTLILLINIGIIFGIAPAFARNPFVFADEKKEEEVTVHNEEQSRIIPDTFDMSSEQSVQDQAAQPSLMIKSVEGQIHTINYEE